MSLQHGDAWPLPLDTFALEGTLMRLEPLGPAHAAEFLAITRNPEIWRFTTNEAATAESLRRYLDSALRDCQVGTAAPFAVRFLGSGRLVGVTRLKNLSRENRTAQVGSWFVPEVWGCGVNTESKLLLLGYAFDRLRCVRIEFQTDSRNLRSRAALRALGATEEAVLRSAQITRDGTRRDSVVFSIIDSEWPAVRAGLTARLRKQGASRSENLA